MENPVFNQTQSPEVEYLYALRRGKTQLGLESTRRLLRSVGSPELRIPMIQVAGTNGKGSTTAFLASLLRSAGLRVGRFTSPHLLTVEERICVDDVPISSDEFSRRVLEIKPQIDAAAASFFEAITVLAALHFRDADVDVAVYEVGLGGRLDSTTAIPAASTVLTSVGHDHEAILGHGLSSILREKLGIVRDRVPLHTGITSEHLMAEVYDYCKPHNAPVRPLPQDPVSVLGINLWEGMEFQLGSVEDRYHTSFLGAHHARNAALAAQTVEDFLINHFPEHQQDPLQGFRKAFMPGRFQCLRPTATLPSVILDVAHNPESMHATLDVAQAVLQHDKPVVVLGMLRDKRLDGVLDRIDDWASRLILTVPHVKRAWDPNAIKEIRREKASKIPIEVIEDPTEALQEASGSNPLLVLGSHYLIGEVMPYLAQERRCSLQSLLRPPIHRIPLHAAS